MIANEKVFTDPISFCFFSYIKSTNNLGWGGDGLSWNDPFNWVGDIVPNSLDDVLLDNTVVPGTYTVTLPTGAVTVSVNTLTITPSGINNISLILPAGNTADPGFSVTSTGDALILNNGAILRNSSGATVGSGVSITNTFRINNGGRYIHNTGRGNAAIVSQLSTALGTEFGIVEFDVALSSYAVSLNNRTYGSLVFSSAANGGTATYPANGSLTCNIRGDLILNSGVTLSISMSAPIIVQQDLSMSPLSTFNLQSSTNNNIVSIAGDLLIGGTITESNVGLPKLELNGVMSQQLTIIGSINNSVTITINNPLGVTLNTSFTLPFNLELTNGKITTTSTNLLTMVDNAIYTGGSTNSFIDGPMKKIGDDNFIFPVGKGSIYAPIGVSGSGGAISDEFTAEYLRTNPQSIHGACPAACAGGLDHVSYVEYWKLNQDAGTSAKQVSLEVHALSFCKMLANTFVSRWNGAQWTNETTAILAGPNACGSGLECGTIQASNTTTAFGDFTLATDQPFLNNPLPVTLVDFKVRKYSEQAAVTEWELTDYCFTATQFELEHSTDKTSFAVIAIRPGKENSRLYFYNDTRIEKGTNWYRLKITEVDGKVTYSKVIAIINDTKGLLITSVFPNPASNTATITLSAARSGMADIQLYDISGTVVYRRRSAIAEGTNNLPIQLGKLSAGVYHLAVQSADSKAVYRLVKQ